MTKYILAGREALQHFNADKHDLVAKAIKDYKGDIFSIDNLDDMAELLENLRGYDDFVEIEKEDRDIIQDELDALTPKLDALTPKAVWINMYKSNQTVWTSGSFNTKEAALEYKSSPYYVKTVKITADI